MTTLPSDPLNLLNQREGRREILAQRQRARRLATAQRRPKFHLTDPSGNIVATATARKEAVELQRQRPELTLRSSRDIVEGVPRARDVSTALREAQVATQRTTEATQRFQEAQKAVDPFRSEEGGVDVVAAVQAGVSEETLERLFPVEVIESAQLTASQLQEIAPFRNADGEVNLVKAIESNISEETLNALFKAEAITQAKGAIQRAEALRIRPVPEGAEGIPEVQGIRIVNRVDLRSLGFPFGDGDVIEHQGGLKRIEGANRTRNGRLQIFFTDGGELIAPRNDPEGRGFVGETPSPEALARVREEIQLRRETAAGLFDPRAGEAVFSEDGELLGFREPIFEEGRIVAIGIRGRDGKLVRLPESVAPLTEEQQREETLRVDVLRRLEEFRVGDEGFRIGEALKERRVSVRDLQLVRFSPSDIAQASRFAAGVSPPSAPDVLPPEEFDPTTGIGSEIEEDFPRADLLQERLAEVGITAAIQSGFTTREELDDVFGVEQIERLLSSEAGFERLSRQAFSPGPRLAMDRLESQGLATPDGQVFITEAIAQGQRGLLLQAGFTPSQIDTALSEQRALERTGRQLIAFEERQQDLTTLTRQVNQQRQLETLRGQIDTRLQETETAIAALTPRQREGLDPGFVPLGVALDQLQAQRKIIEENITTLERREDLPAALPAFPGLEAPGFRAELPEDIAALKQRSNTATGVARQISGISPLGIVGDVTPIINPLEAAATRRNDLINTYSEAIQSGQLTIEQGRGLIREIPRNITPDDWLTARLNLGEFLSTRPGALPLVGLPFAVTGFGLRFDKMSRNQRLIEGALLSAYGVGTLSAANRAARAEAGALTGRARFNAIADATADQEILFAQGLVNHPIKTVSDTVRVGLINPLEAGAHAVRSKLPLPATAGPGLRLMGLEDSVQTMRIAARERFAHDVGAVDMPEGLWKLIDSGEVAPNAIQRATAESTLGVMKTGERTPGIVRRVDGTPTDYQVDIRPSPLHDSANRGFAFSGTPDGRIGMLPDGFEVSEGMLWFSVNPHSRFTLSTSSTRPIQWAPEQLASFDAAGLDKAVPTVYVFSGDELLNQLQPAAKLNGVNVPGSTRGSTPKFHGTRAESEAIAPPGVKTGPAVQRFFRRDNAGNRIQVLVFGDPLTSAEVKGLNIRATYATGRNIVAPGIRWNYVGKDADLLAETRRLGRGKRLGDDFDRLDDSARNLAEDSTRLRSAGFVDEALGGAYEAALTRRAIPGLYPIGGSFGRVDGDLGQRDDTGPTLQSDLDLAGESRLGAAEQRIGGARIVARLPDEEAIEGLRGDRRDIPGDRAGDRLVRVGDLSVTRLDDVGRLTDREIVERLATVERLTAFTETRELTQPERSQAEQVITELGRAPLTPRQRAEVEDQAQILNVRVPDVPRLPDAPSPPDVGRVPGVPEPPRAPRVPDVPGAPRPPTITRVPDIPGPPRTPTIARVPAITELPRPLPPVRISRPSDDDDEERAQLNVRVVGINRGFLDTTVDLVSGETETVQDIEAVPEGNVRASFTPLTFSGVLPSIQRSPWGALDLFIGPGGVRKWVKAGEPAPDLSEFEPPTSGRPRRTAGLRGRSGL